MDPNTIDRLARLVGSGQSRRGVLKTLAGGTLGAIAAVIGIDLTGVAAARCRDTGVVCSKNADCCSTVCLPHDHVGRQVCAECASAADCPGGDQCRTAACTGGACGLIAKANGTPCDDGNASTCGNACANGVCTGRSVDLQRDADNCGSCGRICSGEGAPICAAGECCQYQLGPQGVCSIDLPCCSYLCGDGGYCCLPDGAGSCYTDFANECCSGVCTPTNSSCIGNCPGICCMPEAKATTCAGGKCGSQTNNCGQAVDCGACCSSTCGSTQVCVNDTCLRAYPNCAPCSTETVEGILVCVHDCDIDLCAGAACSASTDCASGAFCAIGDKCVSSCTPGVLN